MVNYSRTDLSSKQRIVMNVASRTGIAALARALMVRDGRFVVALHGVIGTRPADVPRHVQPSMSTDELRAVLAWLRKRFDFLTPEAFFAGNKRGVLLTFDDGLASNYTNALPLLTEFDAPAVFFVAMQHILDPRDWLAANREFALRHWPTLDAVPDAIAADFYDGMTEAQLIEASQHPLITIGAHTVSHPHLPTCSDDHLREELVASKQMLEERIGRDVGLFAYPYADYDRRCAEAVRAAGYRAGFAVDPLPVGLPLFEIPRVEVYWSDAAYLDVKFSGVFRRAVRGRIGVG
jgi:peptidoglycan/xylan/chitin deacetylase (PgdA/CDA1 family)